MSRLMHQWYWPSWWKLWPSYASYKGTRFFFFGPLQIRWYFHDRIRRARKE